MSNHTVQSRHFMQSIHILILNHFSVHVLVYSKTAPFTHGAHFVCPSGVHVLTACTRTGTFRHLHLKSNGKMHTYLVSILAQINVNMYISSSQAFVFTLGQNCSLQSFLLIPSTVMHAFVGVLMIKHLWLQAFKFVLHEVT